MPGLSDLEIIERGPHHRVISFSRPVTDTAGRVSVQRGRYTELQMGLHVLQNGQWVDSEEMVEPAPSGAVASRLPYRATFAANLNTAGAIDLLLPDGQRLRSHLLGLQLVDRSTEKSQVIARVKDCLGEIVPPNQVWYRDAFEGLSGDVRCVARKGSFEVDVVLREAVELPPGFEAARTRIEVVTEFSDAPTPGVIPVRTQPGTDAVDEDLDFGVMRMIQGKAFALPAEAGAGEAGPPALPVQKSWQQLGGSTFLVESVDYLALRPLLASLPRAKSGSNVVAQLADLRSLTPSSQAGPPLRLASTRPRNPGVVLDWVTVTSTSDPFPFLSRETYYVVGEVTLSGPVTIQPETYIKFEHTACLRLSGSVTTPAPDQMRAYLTSKDDNDVGAPLGNGAPIRRAFTAMNLYNTASGTLRRLEIRYADRAMSAYSPSSSLSVLDCRFLDCNIAVGAYYTALTLDDLFMCQVTEWTHNWGYATFSYLPGHQSHIVDNCGAFGDPVIQTQPADITVAAGQNATFTVVALGEGLTYQWYFNNVSLPYATSDQYTVLGATLAKAGEYHVIVRSGASAVTSLRAKLTVICPPQIITQPTPQSVRAGGTANFTVQAIGPGTLTYRWWKGTTALTDIPPKRTGTTTYKLTLNDVQTTTDAGNYSVVVGNMNGSVTSVAVPLTVLTTQDVIYTSNADFDKGYLVNLNHTVVADRLQINASPTPFPYVNVACSGRGTLARIDANTGAIVGEYQTSPDIAFVGRDPSRTTVDRWGNVWVANRADNLELSDGCKGSVTRIGLVIGGIRGTLNGGTFTPDPNGDYLSPPFRYNTCRDRYGATPGDDTPDGYLKTSRRLTDVRRWLNLLDQDTAGGVSTAEDEAILNYVRTLCNETRTLAVDKNNNVWVGGLDRWCGVNAGQRHHQISGLIAASPVPNTVFSPGAGGYGGLVDGYGVLWSAVGDLVHMSPSAGSGLLRFVPNTFPPTPNDWVVKPPFDASGNVINGDYGLAIDPRTQTIWHTLAYDRAQPANSWLVKLDRTTGNMQAKFEHGTNAAQGVAVDYQANVWVAHSMDRRTVGHVKTNGMFVGNIDLGGATDGGQAGPTGVAVDNNGKIWASAYRHNSAVRINPNDGPWGGGGYRVGAVDLTVDLGNRLRHAPPYNQDASPYNYSDMTGFVTLGSTFPSGGWIVVHDEGMVNRPWKKLAWGATTPANSGIQVEVRAANSVTQLPSQDFLDISSYNDTEFGLRTGRFLEIRVTLWREPLSSANPVLDSLKVYAPQ